MKKYLFDVLVFAIANAAVFVIACSDDAGSNQDTDSGSDTDTDSDTDTEYTGPFYVSGAMQKGPLILGSALTVAMMDEEGIPTGVNYNTTTTSDLGEFDIVAAVAGPCELIGQGYYYQEIPDSLSGSLLTIRAFYEIKGADPQSAFLNVFTHMSSGLAIKLYRDSHASGDADTDTDTETDAGTDAGTDTTVPLTVDEAVAEAENILFEQIGIQHPLGALVNHGTAMDLTGADSPDNQYLMALSCIVGKAAELLAEDADEVDAKTQMLANDIRSQIQNSGIITPEYKQYILDGQAALDPLADCVDNLAGYLYEKTGEMPTLPDPNESADMDDDSYVNAQDDDIDGDGVPNDDNGDNVENTADCAIPTAPCEDEAPFDSTVGGGVYVDAVNGYGWQVMPPTGAYTFADAQAYCDGLSFSGHDDWRMPTISELRSLILGCDSTEVGGSCGVTDDCTTCSICSGCSLSGGPDSGCYWQSVLEGECAVYWSISTYGSETTSIWTVAFMNGNIDTVMDNSSMLIRCVRDLF